MFCKNGSMHYVSLALIIIHGYRDQDLYYTWHLTSAINLTPLVLETNISFLAANTMPDDALAHKYVRASTGMVLSL